MDMENLIHDGLPLVGGLEVLIVVALTPSNKGSTHSFL